MTIPLTTHTAPTDPAGPTGQLCNWLATLRLEDVPAAIRERSKLLLLDGVACALVGAKLPWSRTAVDAVAALEGSGDHAIIGWNRRMSAPAAALLNGTFIQGFELDDFHPWAPLHSASLVLPAILAAAEKVGAVSGTVLLRAAVAGFEVGPRVGLALHGPEMLSRGWHSGSVFGTHAAAAAAGTVLGLDAGRFEDAIGLAATQSAGLMAAQYEAMSKRMHHGFSARNGLYAAHLAAGGYTGIKRVFERDYGGFLSTFGEGHSPDASQIADGLGKRWETARIAIKAHAAMGGLHAPLDALADIAAMRPLVASEIEQIEVDLSHAVYHHGWWELARPLTPIGAQMNVAYALAVAVLDGGAMMRQFSPDRINRDDVWALIPRIKAFHEPEFDRGGPNGRGRVRMRVHFTDGAMLSTELLGPRAVLQPLTYGQVIAKFRALTSDVISEERQASIIEMITNIELVKHVEEIASLLISDCDGIF